MLHYYTDFKDFKEATAKVTLQMVSIATHMGMCIYICKPTGECVYASKELCELFERTEAEMRGYGWALAIQDADRNKAYEKWVSSVKNKVPYEDTYTIKTSSGAIKCYTHTRVCFDYDIDTNRFTDNILFYIGTVKKMGY